MPYNKILIFSSCCFLALAIIGVLGFSEILQFVVRDQTALRRRNLMRKFYLKLPIPLNFKVYFFNITNPSKVQKGAKPILKEIGPYCYDAYKEKIDILDNEGEDSLTYTPYETYFFNQENSGYLTQDDYVTVLHPLVVGVVNIAAKDSPPLLPIVDKALKSIFNDPQDVYITTKVRDLLFDGIIINCNIQNISAVALCMQIKGQVPDLISVRKDVYKFSLLGPTETSIDGCDVQEYEPQTAEITSFKSRNGTLPNRIKIFRGIKKSQELGRVVEVNHEKESKVWSSKKCNRFRGTDGWIFPPFVNKDFGLWSYSPDLCKNVHLNYVEQMRLHGIHVDKYYADLGDMSSNPDEKCYCPSRKMCLPKGIMDLTKCMGVPIYATLPHFLRVDETVQNTVSGLNPVTDSHTIRVLMQPMLGVPLEAQMRMQFNLPIKAVQKISFMKTLPTALHPIFWVEQGVALEGTLLKLIKTVFIGLKVLKIVIYILLAALVVTMGYGGYLHYQQGRRVTITPVERFSSASSQTTQFMTTNEKNLEKE